MFISEHRHRTVHGSVMVLVVAVLALLVVIGTIFIVSARTERNTSAAMSASINLNFARDAVVNVVRQTISDSLVDGSGDIGGSSTSLTYGGLASRNFDYPEAGANGAASINTSAKNEAWLCAHLHNQNSLLTQNDSVANDMSLITPLPYNPATGNYTGLTNTRFPYTASSTPLDTVVGDQTQVSPGVTTDGIDGTLDDPPTKFSDSYINLLPFSDASGIRYRFGVRIIDTNRMANLNTGSVIDALALTDKNGTNLTSIRLNPGSDMNYVTDNYFKYGTSLTDGDGSDPATTISIHNSNPLGLGRTGSEPIAFDLASWQTTILSIEKPTDTLSAFFEPSEELELRSYGEFGSSYHIRAASLTSTALNTYRLWPFTLGCATGTATPLVFNPVGGRAFGNPRRRNYTTYSFSRELRPYADPSTNTPNLIFTLNDSPTWPYTAHTAGTSTINRVPINMKLVSNAQSLGQLATAIATSMVYTSNNSYRGVVTDYTGNKPFPDPNANGNSAYNDANPFTQDEVCAFALNYMEARWSGLIADPSISATTAYFLPAGPSFIDELGVCVRTATSATTLKLSDTKGTNDLTAPTGKIYVGYSAQPFINEVAFYASSPDPVTAPTVTDMAIELFNPYNTTLSLNGFSYIIGTQTRVFLPAGAYIPAHGFYVITTAQGHYGAALGAIQNTQTLTVPPAGQTKITLYRPYIARTKTAFSNTDNVAIDQTDFAGVLIPANFNGGPKDDSWARDNINPAPITAGNWGAAYEATASPKPTTIGTLNSGTASYHPIFDRNSGSPELASSSSQQFVNIAEFNRIMRICTSVNATGDLVAPSDLVASKMYTIVTSPLSATFAAMQYGIEAQLYFDFMACPQIYAPNAATIGSGKPGDVRAVRFLDQLAFIDRVSDVSIDIGLGTTDINKIRLPGQININTASASVIRALPAIKSNIGGKDPDVLVANIIAYRQRTGKTTVTYNGKTNTIDYSDHLSATSKYPGLGFRSIEEVMVPITDYLGVGSDLFTRESMWASIYNLCTVRSDTFAVYGYLEAVKRNPGYNPLSADDWYGAVTDDPNNIATTTPLLRVGRRRFIAIVDRSWSNVSPSNSSGSGTFAMPRVIAIKDLPR